MPCRSLSMSKLGLPTPVAHPQSSDSAFAAEIPAGWSTVKEMAPPPPPAQ